MAEGLEGLVGALDVPGLRAVEDRLGEHERARSVLHAGLLADALALDGLLAQAGAGVGAGAHLALLLGCSQVRAEQLLAQARLLGALPDGLAVLRSGLVTVEQTAALLAETAALPPELVPVLWQRLVSRLEVLAARGGVLPPARLREQLRRWATALEPGLAVRRRRHAEAGGSVEYRRRDDGLVDLFALGITGPNARACLDNIARRSAPTGPQDDRSADKRRLDALVDLLTGRDTLPTTSPPAPATRCGRPGGACSADATGAGGAAGAGDSDDETVCADDDDTAGDVARSGRRSGRCGCGLGQAVPCGAQVQVLVPLGAALGTTDELAELVGHGPLDPDLLAQLLATAPVLRAVWIDEHGVPLATSSRTHTPGRRDPVGLRRALLTLAAQPPPPPEQWHPRHPDDHPDPDPDPDTAAVALEVESSTGVEPDLDPDADTDAGHGAAGRAAAPGDVRSDVLGTAAGTTAGRGAPHPDGEPGPYTPSVRQRRLLTVRRPTCEWPGCGTRALRCDLDHDLAHPTGPTCACNLGPLCRRHHRVKQTGWTKTRQPTAVTWTGPTGRTWTSPTPHQPPQRPARPLGPVPVPHPLDLLSPLQLEDEIAATWPDSPWLQGSEPSGCSEDPGPPDDHDPLADRLHLGTTPWTLDLADHDAWHP